MNITSIFIGNELLNGQTANVNILHLGEELTKAGHKLSGSTVVPDGMDAISVELQHLLPNNDVIIICGGLGPTEDDITRKAVAHSLGMETGYSEEVCQFLKAYMAKKNRQPSDEYFQRQSEVIFGAEVIINRVGLAPGLHITKDDKDIFLLPGPPREFNPMVTQDVLPILLKKSPSSSYSELFHLYGISESKVEDRFQKILKLFPFISPAYCANLGHVKLTVTYSLKYMEKRQELNKKIYQEFSTDITKYPNLIDDIAEIIMEKSWTLSTAESCTGGWIGQAITAYPGASNFFVGSINTYSNEWKVNQLGVKSETLDAVGAVSEECATEMVNGLCQKYTVDCGIAVTGIAGPAGGTDEKPVGLVYIATKTPDSINVSKRLFGGNRKEVREQTVRYALNQLRLQLLGK
ncbi:MAG: CinA family nicotinamide mononucleotide deamidase-related protein [Lentisphaeraceae bacterium]|nr:CinA family nicotinamide mononucleotide deamidase-related protein [Lentisphaeraceae bacterium]